MLLESLAFKWGFYAMERLEQLPINFGISCEHWAKIIDFIHYTFIYYNLQERSLNGFVL